MCGGSGRRVAIRRANAYFEFYPQSREETFDDESALNLSGRRRLRHIAYFVVIALADTERLILSKK